MSWSWLLVLAQGDDGGGFGSLAYVVALLILSVAGAVIDKFKQKADDSRRKSLPKSGPRPAGREDADQPPPRRPEPARRDVPQRPAPRVRTEPPADRPRRPARPAPSAQQPGQPQARPAAPRPPRAQPVTVVTVAQSIEEHLSRPRQASGSPQIEDHTSLDALAKSRTSTPSALDPHRTSRRPGKLRIMGRRLDQADLRRAIILNELLQPPLALRDRGESL